MTTTGPPSADGLQEECALVTGEPECRCAQDAPDLTDEQVVDRALGMMRWEQRARRTGKAAVRRGLDAMLGQARAHGRCWLVAELLRVGLMIRLLGIDDADASETETLLQEFVELAELDGAPQRLAEAAILRAHRAVLIGHGEHALADAATALAILTDITGPAPGADPARWSRHLNLSLNGLVLVLLKLGSHELADEVSQRAVAVAQSGGPMDRLVHQLNRVRLQLSWALRLERGGRDAAAATRFVGAARTAHVAAQLWGPAMTRGGVAPRPAVQDCAVVGAAYALQRPSAGYLEVLHGLRPVAHFTEDRIVLAIASARCYLAAGRPADAAAVLAPLHEELRGGGNPDKVLTLALHREVARVDRIADADAGRSEALQHYAAALESELWALREARQAALRSYSEHHRLAREHGAVAAQALQDPLTGLPNRRALDMRLKEVTSTPGIQPCAVALIDLDGFKDVNDARSHATGDAVLREIATCLRTVLRAQDLVARYGGDEFVVVMPSTSLPVACAALQRATDAVAALPVDAALGVTMSVGVARAPLGDEPAAALSVADAAMYRAKHAGGNTVVSGTGVVDGADDHRGTGRVAPPAPPVARPLPPQRADFAWTRGEL